MTDDDWKRICDSYADENQRFADRIEKLESALHEWDALIRHQYNGSREAMSDMQDAAQITAALLHGEAPWPETRIEKLEAALEVYSCSCSIADEDDCELGDWANISCGYRARKALGAE